MPLEAAVEAAVGPALAKLDEAVAGIIASAAGQEQADKLAQEGLVKVPDAEMVKFRVPSASASDVALIAGARAMAAAAEPSWQAFEALGRPGNFATQLREAADVLERRIVERDAEQIRRRRAVLGVKVGLGKARALLRVLTRIVVEKLRDHTDLVGARRTAIRIG